MQEGSPVSDTDGFIDEVNDELRRDRLFAMMRRYGWIAILLVLVVVAGAGWREYSRAQASAEAQAFGDALMSALEAETAADRVSALQAVPTTGPGQAALTAMLAASEAAAPGEDRDPEAAAAALDGVGGEGLDPIYGQLASLKRLMLQSGEVAPAERRQGLEMLAAAGGPIRLLAQEQIALTHVEEGATDQALEVLQAILVDAEVTQGLRQRATRLIVALGGEPAQAG